MLPGSPRCGQPLGTPTWSNRPNGCANAPGASFERGRTPSPRRPLFWLASAPHFSSIRAVLALDTGMMVSRLWRTAKRAVAIALIGLTVGLLAVPETSLAASHRAPSGVHVVRPADGVGDSPIMP
jgi:hypothetical protein